MLFGMFMFNFFVAFPLKLLNHCQMLDACMSKNVKYRPTYGSASQFRA